MNKQLRPLAIAVMMFSVLALNAQSRDFNFDNTARNEGLTVEQNTRSGLQMRHALKHLSIVSISDNGYAGEEIHAGTGIALPANAGDPNLPSFSRFVAVPNGATAHIEMGYHSMTTIQNVDLLAAAPIKFDTDDSPDTHEKNMDVYGRNAFYPEQPVTISEPFTLRGVQTVAVTVVPFQYNPVTQELRVYDDLQFGVRFDGGNGEFGDNRLRSPYWDPILMQNLANYNQLPVMDYEARMQEWVNTRPEGCEYLIVIPNNENFRQYANQLAEYRIQQGIITEVKSLAEMGCTTTAMMRSYFHNAYNTWAIPPVAVLLLGDHNTNMSVGIPAETTYHSQNYGYCITDNGYADVTGDLLPEMAFSRLVAANANEAQMMVSKQLEYEFTNPNMDPESYDHPITALGWQTVRWFQICSEVVGGYWRNQGKHPVRINAIYEGMPGNIWSSNQNTSMVVNYFGPIGTGYIPATPSELGGWTGGTGAQVVQAVNNGCMLLQHRDHGYYQGWGEPDFSNSHVAQMTNVGKLTFVNTINCQTGTFDYGSNCLVEAFMRRTFNGQNAGAVGCIGPTQTSYSFVNDTYAWGMYDQYDPEFLPTYGPYANYEGNWRPAFGNVAGKYFLQQSSWPYNVSNKAITHKMFTAHCDAFLTLYTQVPKTMTVAHPSHVNSSTTSINVTATAGTIIALTKDNEILAVATATGISQTITFAAQPSNSTITIVGTKQDYLRYVGSIDVISEPYLEATEVVINDGNNAQLEYGEQANFNLVIKNTGDLASTAGSVSLSTETPDFVTITNGTAAIPALEPNQTFDLTEAFGITVADNVPNESNLRFTFTMADNSHSWSSRFSVLAYAPILNISEHFVIDDGGTNKGNGNGRLDPGETATVTFTYSNNGGAPADNVTATLSTESDHISITQPNATSTQIDIGETVEVSYVVSISAQMPRGEAAIFNLSVVAGHYSSTQQFSHRVGLEIANFEYGIDGFDWQNDPEHPWTISATEPYSGSHCLQSGNISHGQTSTISLTYEVENLFDEIRFFRKTDCELNGDNLRFYVDGELKQEWSGTLNWREMTFGIGQGEHTFTWTYEKNSETNTGSDQVWIDDILFPLKHVSFACNAGPDQETCYFGDFNLEGMAIGYQTVEWSSNGDGRFESPNELNTLYYPGLQDIENKTVTFTLTATNAEGETLSDNLTGILHSEASIEMAESAEICEGETYELHAIVTEAEHLDWEFIGDGSIGDANSPITTYTPGPMDIENGFVPFYLHAFSGCGDDAATFTLYIHRNQHSEFEMTTCGAYSWNGVEYSEEGDYEQLFQSIHGCDSIVTMHLTMVDAYHTETEMTACDSYVWAGETFIQSGDYLHTFTSAYGCDSVVMMHLTINEHSEKTIEVEACDSFDWDGTTYTESGVYERVYTNVNGCDSIVMMVLTVYATPMIETIDGETEIDVRLTPTSVYSAASNSLTIWSIEPEEAGTVDFDIAERVATITWSDTYKGEALLTAFAEDYCGQVEKSLAINVKNSTDVSENNIQTKVFPNPTDGMVTVEAKGIKRIAVMNALGQVVHDTETHTDQYLINLGSLGKGLYLIRIYTENGVDTKRITVK